jgi:hypothetical protein
MSFQKQEPVIIWDTPETVLDEIERILTILQIQAGDQLPDHAGVGLL